MKSMATKKSRLVIAFILMLTMVSFFSLPASVFAAETEQASVSAFAVSVSDVTTNTAKISWTPNDENFGYEVSVPGGSYDSSTFIVSGLSPDTEYTVTVTKSSIAAEALVSSAEVDFTDVSNLDLATTTESDSETFRTLPLINLWVSADDAAEVYINGNSVVVVTPSAVNAWATVSAIYVDNILGTPFIAAKGMDLANVIAGFKLVFKINADSYLSTNDNSWYYYTGDGAPVTDIHGIDWTEESYQATDGWEKVSSVPPHTSWVVSGFPTTADWIWSPYYETELGIDTPVYFRSAQPKEVTYKVTFESQGRIPVTLISGITSGSSLGVTLPTNVSPSPFIFLGWSTTSPGAVDFTSSTSINSNLTVYAQWTPINLWVASDDHADVYIDGSISTSNSSYSIASRYLRTVSNTPFVAAKAWDTNGKENIAGFKLVLQNNNGTYISTNSSWFYYNKFNTWNKDDVAGKDSGIVPATDAKGKNWTDSNYQANLLDWSPVTFFTLAQAPGDHDWAKDGEFPGNAATWIWSPNFDVPTSTRIDTPVYLRSMAPAEIPTTGTINVYKDVIGANGTDVNDATPFSFTYQSVSSEIGANIVVGGTVIEGAATPVTLRFGTYKFTELTPIDKYTDITTGGSVTVTISEGGLTADVLFVNQLKENTPIDPVDPVRPTPRRTITVSEEPTPAGPIITPEVVLDEQVPAAPLPKTGGLDPSFLYGLGALLATGGFVIRKRKDK
jgi:LPXTG-motif cell wall-anchored protein